jgi:glucosamine--fructose-6-phosphate aminotransferase (isomerizing)
MFMPTDAAAPGMQQLAADLRRKGAALFCTGVEGADAGRLPALPIDHPETDAICLVQSFYGFVLRLAAMCGTDVDQPRHLEKVTRTR